MLVDFSSVCDEDDDEVGVLVDLKKKAEETTITTTSIATIETEDVHRMRYPMTAVEAIGDVMKLLVINLNQKSHLTII